MFAALLWPSLLLAVVLVLGAWALLACRLALRPRSADALRYAAIASIVLPVAAKAQSVVCDTACTVTHVITIETPVFNLDAAGGAEIAGAILAVWAVGWAFRVLIRTLNVDGNSSTSESE